MHLKVVPRRPRQPGMRRGEAPCRGACGFRRRARDSTSGLGPGHQQRCGQMVGLHHPDVRIRGQHEPRRRIESI
jgi:hypothetical protein